MAKEEEELLTAQEVAEAKGVKVNTVYAAIGRGRLPTVQKYGKTLIRQSDADAFSPTPRPARRKQEPLERVPDEGQAPQDAPPD